MDNDLISRSALMAAYDSVHLDPRGGAYKLILEAPAVDAVRVVRCRDCIHFNDENGPKGWCKGHIQNVDPDYYCASGKRKDGGET